AGVTLPGRHSAASAARAISSNSAGGTLSSEMRATICPAATTSRSQGDLFLVSLSGVPPSAPLVVIASIIAGRRRRIGLLLLEVGEAPAGQRDHQKITVPPCAADG